MRTDGEVMEITVSEAGSLLDEEVEAYEVGPGDRIEAPFPALRQGDLLKRLSGSASGEAYLKEAVEYILTQYESHKDDHETLMKERSDQFNVIAGKIPRGDESLSRVHRPVMLTALIVHLSRIYEEALGKENWMMFKPRGPDDDTTAELMTLDTLDQLKSEVVDFKEHMTLFLMDFLTSPMSVVRSFFNKDLSINRHVHVDLEDLVIPYRRVSTMPDMSDLPWKIVKTRYVRSELEAKQRAGWHNIDTILSRAPHDTDEIIGPREEAIKAHFGIDTQMGGEWELLEWTGFLTYPGQKDTRYFYAIVDPVTRVLADFRLYEDDSREDMQRYQSQLDEMARWEELQKQQDDMAIQTGVDPASLAPVPLPKWAKGPGDKPSPIKQAPLHLFSCARALPLAFGSFGISMGKVLADHNKAADTFASLFTHQAVMNNRPSFATGNDSNIPDVLEARPDGVLKIPMKTDDLRKALVQIQFPPANPQLMELSDREESSAKSALGAADILTGAPGKSQETRDGYLARLGEAQKPLTFLGDRFVSRGLQQVISNNTYLNAKHRTGTKLRYLFSHKLGRNLYVDFEDARSLYRRGYDVELRTDMLFLSGAERRALADELLALVTKNPFTAQNPAINHAALVESFRSRNKEAWIPLLGEPPPPPEQFVPPPPPEPQQGDGGGQ